MNSRTLAAVTIALVGLAFVMAGVSYQEHRAWKEWNSQFIARTLEPIAALLKEDQTIVAELQAPLSEPGTGILELYLAKIRRDGVPKHADMKQKLDTLAENNAAIVTLIKAYAPQAKTAAFKFEADKFRNYASAWRDRWNSVMEIFMAGGNYAVAVIPFPAGFPAALEEEIAAVK